MGKDKIVLLHGLAAGRSFFGKLEKELSVDFETLSFDLLGFGKEKKQRVILHEKNT